MGLLALWHVGSVQTRDQTYVPYTGKWILNHWTTREVSPPTSHPFFSGLDLQLFASILMFSLVNLHPFGLLASKMKGKSTFVAWWTLVLGGYFQCFLQHKFNNLILAISCCGGKKKPWRVRFYFAAGLDCRAKIHRVRYSISITENVKAPKRICWPRDPQTRGEQQLYTICM